MFGTFPKEVPIHLWVSDTEVLLDDSRRLCASLGAQGLPCELIVEHDLPHVWPIFPSWILPESKRALDEIADRILGATAA